MIELPNFTPFEISLIYCWFVTLMLCVWYQHRQGFRKGAVAGYFMGLNKGARFMVDHNMISGADKDGNPLCNDDTVSTMVRKLMESDGVNINVIDNRVES
jgi:hypothetical protein